MWRGGTVKIFPGKIKDEELQKAQEQGRAGKYVMDLGWRENYTVYVVYGKSGGSKEAIAITEAILQAIRREIKAEAYVPTLIVGDVNKDPGTLHTVKELKQEDTWVDVGAVADWWGGRAAEPTCHTRDRAKPTRIDCVLANPPALITIHDFEVEKHVLIPTHSILRIELTKRAWKEEQQCLKKMGSLKKLLEAKIQAATKGMNRKEEAETRKKAIQEMQDDMNHNFEEAKEELEKARTLNDTNLFWKLWSSLNQKACPRPRRLWT